jgi:hypothetical protein
MREEKGNRAEDFQCWHWCPVGKHDWCHRIEDLVNLDEWEKTCPKHAEQKAA